MLNFTRDNFHTYCDALASMDSDLLSIVQTYGYPPMWTRPNTFETLVQIILEQQVSLASAAAALEKLRERVKEITPGNVAFLSDDEIKACYFSRQKTSYVRQLALTLLDGWLKLTELERLPDDEVRNKLVNVKGIGRWTADVYLIFALQRRDVFPFGDLAAVTALKCVKNLPADASPNTMVETVSRWQPYRSIAAMLLWHHYLSSRVLTKESRKLTK